MRCRPMTAARARRSGDSPFFGDEDEQRGEDEVEVLFDG